jgi:winged helix DNA-binding protein
MSSSRLPVLSSRALNRATLARQLLLAPVNGVPPVEALERIGAVQAQEPASPYLALWTRLADFDPAALHAAFVTRDAIKASLMRITLHAVSARDYLPMLAALLPMYRETGALRRGTRRPDNVRELAAAAAAFSATPRRSAELRDYLATWSGTANLETPVWWWVRRHLPMVHVPEDGPWSFSRRPLITTASAWFEDPTLDDGGGMDLEAARLHVVRRYLAAFGPATTADLAAWTGVSAGDFRSAISKLDADGALVRLADEAGRTLLDLADAPRPDPGVPAVARFLPMWDSVLLAFRDRTRVISDEDRLRVVSRNGDVLPTFLVDGRVAGFWWAEPDGGGTRIVLEPFGRLAAAYRRDLETEADRLAAFVGPREPAVYGRYRVSGARRR